MSWGAWYRSYIINLSLEILDKYYWTGILGPVKKGIDTI